MIKLENIKILLEEMRDYSNQINLLKDANFTNSQVKIFRKYHNKLYVNFIIFVNQIKDKEISEKGKSLKTFSDIFKKAMTLQQVLSSTVFVSSLCLIYLFYIKAEIGIFILATLFVMAIVSFLIKQVQTQPKFLIESLNKNAEIISNIEIMISRFQKIK